MNEQLHIIIAGEEGGSRSLSFSKKQLFTSISLFSLILIGLVTGCLFATNHTVQNTLMQKKIAKLEEILHQNQQTRQELKERITVIEKNNRNHLSNLQVKHDLETTTLKLENIKLMSTAVSELNERSELIEEVMDNVGVKIIKDNPPINNKNSGGPFIPQQEDSYDELLDKADQYLDTIKTIPLGRPVPGTITSRYGKRVDPVNGKRGFHTGVDIRGKKGDKILCTASGVVIKAFYNGGYGNYVKIKHGNGYETIYAHMQNYVVRKGDRVIQGQLIGQVGNSGRSTGPHLHYEIVLNDKTVNPNKFMKIADLSRTFSTTPMEK